VCGTVEPLVRGRSHRPILRLLVALAGFLLVLGLPSTGPAQSPGAAALRQKSAELAARARTATLELYGLESRLQQARGDLARVDAQAAELATQQASAQRRFQAARATTRIAQARLGEQLRWLYEQGEPDPIAVILGATSFEDAVEGLESINRAARVTESVLEEARTARTRLTVIRRELALRVERTKAARARVAATTAGLEQARTERTAYIGQLRQEQQLTAAQITSLEQRVQAAQAKAQQVTQQVSSAAEPASPAEAPPSAPGEPPPSPVESVSGGGSTSAPVTGPPRPGGTMQVLATAYCLRGTTATGLPVGPGIVATDPTVIPLGTRMTIPGYGEGVAADTGSAVKGAHIDVWLASCSEALAFTRTVTITFR
jgi:cystine transport system substrate-binding protein